MKRFIIILLCVFIISNTVYKDTVEVRAIEPISTTVALVTGEAIFSLLCSAFVVCGFLAVDNPNADFIENDIYLDILADEYESYIIELIESGVIENYECSVAFDILFQYNSLEDGCQALADAINEARSLGLDLNGIPINTTDYDSMLRKINSTAFTDTYGNTVVTPELMNSIVNDIAGLTSTYVASQYNEKIENTSTSIYAGSGNKFEFGKADFVISLFQGYINSYGIDLENSSWGIVENTNSYTLYYTLYPFYHSRYGESICCGNRTFTYYKNDGSINVHKLTSTIYIDSSTFVAWNFTDTTRENVSYLPTLNNIDNSAISMDNIENLENIDNIYNDLDTLKDISSDKYVEDIVVIPPVNKVLDNSIDISTSIDGTMSDTEKKVAVKEKVDTLSKDTTKELEESLSVDLGLTLYSPSSMVTSPALTDKFPFCIPFDLIDSIAMFSAVGEAPRWEIPLVIEEYGINEKIVIDLKDFDTVASIVRAVELAIFIVSLILLTRKIVK